MPSNGGMNSRATRWALGTLLVMGVGLAYWPGLSGGFVFDDTQNIVSNPTLSPDHWGLREFIAATISSPASSLQRPLAMFTFALDAYFSGLDPRAMKLTNLLIHAMNALLVFGLLRSLLLSVVADTRTASWIDRRAAIVSGFWALHPINLMGVLYVVQRMESLSHTFVFTGLWMYLAGRQRILRGQAGWVLILAGLIGGTGLGILSKESAALLPLYALAIECVVFRFRSSAGSVDRKIQALYGLMLVLPGIATAIWYLPTALAPGRFSGRSFTLAQRLLSEPLIVMDYLKWMVIPDIGQLSLYHDDVIASTGPLSPPATLIGLIGIPLLLIVAFWLRKLRPLTSLGLLWFLSAHLLTATILPLELVFEHRNYFASLGICLVLGDLLLVAPTRRSTVSAGLLVSVALLVLYCGLTNMRSREWGNPARLSLTEVIKHPNSPRATYDAARALVEATRYRADSPVVGLALEALERARAVPGSGILPEQAALIFTARAGIPAKTAWWESMQGKLRGGPIGSEDLVSLVSLNDCAVEGLCKFPPERMLQTFEAALSQNVHPGVLSIYGKYAVHVLHDSNLALQLWSDASSLEPKNPVFRANLAMLYIQLGNYEQAKKQISALKELGRLGEFDDTAEGLSEYLQEISQSRRLEPQP